MQSRRLPNVAMPLGVILFGALLSVSRVASLIAQAPRAATAPAAGIDSTALLNFKWRHVGPEGNRVTSVTGVIGDRTTYYAGAASGGLWKTTDAGTTWAPIFEDQPVSSIGSGPISPSR